MKFRQAEYHSIFSSFTFLACTPFIERARTLVSLHHEGRYGFTQTNGIRLGCMYPYYMWRSSSKPSVSCVSVAENLAVSSAKVYRDREGTATSSY